MIDAWLTESRTIDLQIVSIFALVWLAFYMLVRRIVFPSLSADSANRVVSLVHALLGLVWPLCVIDFSRLRSDVGTESTEQHVQVLRVSLAYFFYDMLCCMAIEFDIVITLHHVATILGLFVGVFNRTSGHELLLCLVLMEASNPFMHLRCILRDVGYGKTRLADINDVVFAVTFLLCRNVLGLFVVYWTVMSSTTPLLVKAGGVGILAVSLFWTQKLVSMIARKLSKADARKSE